MANDYSEVRPSRSPNSGGPNSGGTVNGWLVAILLIVFAALYLQMNGFWPTRLLDPNAAPRAVTPRGDLAQDEQTTIAIFRAASKSVVHITTTAVVPSPYRMNPFEMKGSGSGFIWDENGYIVTNFHVVRDARQAHGKIKVFLFDSSSYDARIVGISRANDLAVLKINAPAGKLKPVLLGTSSDLQVGQKVFAIGSPFSLDQSLTMGIVSGLGREIKSESGTTIKDVIQVNAAINPGNSGGPLLDSAGRLIGVNAAILSETGEFSGIGFAIPVDTVNAVIPQLMRSGSAEPPALGITLFSDEQSASILAALKIDEKGVLVNAVWPGGAAEAAGLQPTRQDDEGRIALGDFIIAVNEKPVHSAKDVAQAIAGKKVGERVTLTVLRDGKHVDVPVTLQPRPERPEE